MENGRFAHVLEDVPGPAEDLDGALVIPGLVDIHVHGCAGADFSDGDYAGLCVWPGIWPGGASPPSLRPP